MFRDRTNITLVLAVIALIYAFLLTGCGGGTSAVPTGNSSPESNNTQAATPSNILPLGSPIPAIPTGLNDSASQSGTRSVSAILDYPGANFLTAAGATVDGNDLILQSSEDDVAWAMYKAEDLTGLCVTKFAIETIPGSLDTEYSVGLSNYDDGRWEYYITTSLPEAEIDLSDETIRLISSLGNCYWVVVVWGGESLRILEGHLFTEDDPGIPGDPNDYPFPIFGQIDYMADDHFVIWTYDDCLLPPGPGDDPDRNDPIGDHPCEPPGDHQVRIDFNADTVWFDENGEAGPADFGPGDDVMVDAVLINDGETILAMIVQKFEDPGPGYPGVSLIGEIATIGDGLITLVEDISCNYDEHTEWFTIDGPGTEADFAPGDFVIIDAQEIDGLSGLMADFVMELPEEPGDPTDPNDPDPGDVWPFDGEITAIGGGRLTIAWEGAEIGISYNEDTVWFDENGEAGPEDFAVGDFVHIDAMQLPDGWLALFVMHLGEPGDPGDPGDPDFIVFCGEVEAITASTIEFFDGFVVDYDEGTLWFDEMMDPITPADVDPGDFVLVEAMVDELGDMLAITVHRMRNDTPEPGTDPDPPML